jgi:hypothetical protein
MGSRKKFGEGATGMMGIEVGKKNSAKVPGMMGSK